MPRSPSPAQPTRVDAADRTRAHDTRDLQPGRLDTSPDAMLVMTDVPAALACTPPRRRDDVAGGPRAREPTRPRLDRRILGQRRLRRRRPFSDVRPGRRGLALDR